MAFDVDRELCSVQNTNTELFGSHVRTHYAIDTVSISHGESRKTKRMCTLDQLFRERGAFQKAVVALDPQRNVRAHSI
jgi:hypothetical protein